MALFGRPTENDQHRAEAWKRWLRRKHPMAIASLVFGIISFIEFGVLLVFGIAGIVMGAIAVAQIRRQRMRSDGQSIDGSGLAWWGIALNAISLFVAARFMYEWI